MSITHVSTATVDRYTLDEKVGPATYMPGMLITEAVVTVTPMSDDEEDYFPGAVHVNVDMWGQPTKVNGQPDKRSAVQPVYGTMDEQGRYDLVRTMVRTTIARYDIAEDRVYNPGMDSWDEFFARRKGL